METSKEILSMLIRSILKDIADFADARGISIEYQVKD